MGEEHPFTLESEFSLIESENVKEGVEKMEKLVLRCQEIFGFVHYKSGELNFRAARFLKNLGLV